MNSAPQENFLARIKVPLVVSPAEKLTTVGESKLLSSKVVFALKTVSKKT